MEALRLTPLLLPVRTLAALLAVCWCGGETHLLASCGRTGLLRQLVRAGRGLSLAAVGKCVLQRVLASPWRSTPRPGHLPGPLQGTGCSVVPAHGSQWLHGREKKKAVCFSAYGCWGSLETFSCFFSLLTFKKDVRKGHWAAARSPEREGLPARREGCRSGCPGPTSQPLALRAGPLDGLRVLPFESVGQEWGTRHPRRTVAFCIRAPMVAVALWKAAMGLGARPLQ